MQTLMSDFNQVNERFPLELSVIADIYSNFDTSLKTHIWLTLQIILSIHPFAFDILTWIP